MKISSILRYALLFIMLTGVNLDAQKAVLTGKPFTMEENLFGYNNFTWRGGSWDNPEYRFTAGRAHPGNVRYPGGTISNYWDWRNGTPMKTAVNSWPKYIGDEFAYTPEEFVKGIPKDAEIIYCVNIARPTPITGISPYASLDVLKSQETLDAKIKDILEGIEAFAKAGHPLKYVEIGNEFYHNAVGGVDAQGAIYTGNPELYVNHANQLIEKIKTRWPEMKIAVVGEDNRKAEGKAAEWTQSIYDAIEDGRLNHVNAITMHWYEGPETPVVENAEQSMHALAQTFRSYEKKKALDYDNLPKGLDIWVTEYNTWSRPHKSTNPMDPGFGGSIQGSWINGLFGANLGLLYIMMGEQVTWLNVHQFGYSANTQWNTFDNDSTLSGNGVAFGCVGRAVKGMNTAQPIKFEGILNPTFEDNRPSVYGARFENAELGKQTCVIFNYSDQVQKNVDISSLFSLDGNKRMTQYFDETPWTRHISELDPSFNYIENISDKITIPPFSISVVEQESKNYLKNGGFEQTGKNWKGDGIVINNRKRAFSGHHSIFIDNNKIKDKEHYQLVDVEKGKSYVFKGMIQTLLEQGYASLKVSFLDKNEKVIEEMYSDRKIFGATSFNMASIHFDVPKKASRLKIALALKDAKGFVWFDDAMLMEK